MDITRINGKTYKNGKVTVCENVNLPVACLRKLAWGNAL